MSAFDPAILAPGDVLLYAPSDLIGDVIATKTWEPYSHAEVFIGPGQVLAARIDGVNLYPVRLEDLTCVRRPLMPLNLSGALAAVSGDIGKAYEIAGLLKFFQPKAVHKHIFRICSVIVNKFLRGGGVDLFNPDMSDDDVAPAQLWQTGLLETIWNR